jgi:hypothetical protein
MLGPSGARLLNVFGIGVKAREEEEKEGEKKKRRHRIIDRGD